jgi:predicted Zn-dependent peptidase
MSGAVKLADVKKWAETYLEPIPAQPAPPPVHIVEPPQTGERRIEVQKDVASAYLGVAYKTPASTHDDYYALTLLSDILSSGNSSRLYSSLVDQQQLASTVFVNYGESFDPMLFAIYAVTARNVQPEKLENAIYAELDKIIKEGVTEKELQKVKNKKLIEFYNQVETINGKSNNLGTYEVFFGDYRKMFEAPERFNKVSVADIQRVAKTYFKKDTRTFGILKKNTAE